MFIYMPIPWITLSLVFPFFFFPGPDQPAKPTAAVHESMYSHLASLLFLHKVDDQVLISDFVLSLGVLARIQNPLCWEGIVSFFSYRPSTSLAWLCWKLTLAIGQVDRWEIGVYPEGGLCISFLQKGRVLAVDGGGHFCSCIRFGGILEFCGLLL